MASVNIKINGVSHYDWASIHIIQSLDFIAGGISVSNTNFLDTNIKLGDSIIAEIGTDFDKKQVINGYVDSMPIDNDSENVVFEIYARDTTGDLMDCSFDQTPNEWLNQPVSSIIKNLCSQHEIDLIIDSSVASIVSQIIPKYTADTGKTIAVMISELSLDYAFLAISKGDGKLTLTSPTTTDKTTDSITKGINAYRGKLMATNISRFSNYTVKGVGNGSDLKSLTDWTEPSGTFTDSMTPRTRPITIFSDTATDIAKCENRAKWQARIHAGQSRQLFYEVIQWTQSDNSLWDFNKLVPVVDDDFGIRDTLLINMIEYIKNEEEGEYTRIWVVDKSTYDLSSSAIGIKTRFDN